MNIFAELGLIISIIALFFTGLTKKEKYDLNKIKKVNIVIACIILLVLLFHDVPQAIEGFMEGFNSNVNN